MHICAEVQAVSKLDEVMLCKVMDSHRVTSGYPCRCICPFIFNRVGVCEKSFDHIGSM